MVMSRLPHDKYVDKNISNRHKMSLSAPMGLPIMHASKTPMCRLVDYSARLKFDGIVALRKQIVSYVGGVRGTRKGALSEDDIVAWFRSTPAEFVRLRIAEEVGKGLRSTQRPRGGNVYEAAA